MAHASEEQRAAAGGAGGSSLPLGFWVRAGKVFDRILDLLTAAAGVLVIFQVVSVTISVCARLFTGRSLDDNVVPFNEWSIFAIMFMGVALVQRERGHVNMETWTMRVGRRMRLAADLFSTLIGIVVSAVLMYYGGQLTLQYWREGAFDAFKMPGFPIAVIYAFMPTCCFLLLIQFLRDGYGYLTGHEEKAHEVLDVMSDV